MAVKFTAIKCPECGANLNIEENKSQMFCSYCGSKIIMINENEYIYHHIDDARIKQVETDRIIQLKKIELIEKKRVSAIKNKIFKLIISIPLGAIIFFCLVIGYSENALGLILFGSCCGLALILMWSGNNKEDSIDFNDKIKVPPAIIAYENKNFTVIETMFIDAGFNNVMCIPLNDLKVGLIKKPGMVESISINGQVITAGGRRYPSDASVIISYHSFS